MQLRFLFSTILLVSWSLSCAASATVTVDYDKPEQYADMPTFERDTLLKDLRHHFEHLGAKLPAGQDLHVEVVDLHIAGWLKPTARLPGEIRVLHGGADWPTMHLRYRVEANGQTVKNGDEELSNMMYLQRMNNYPEDDNLRYEKQMLDDWFRKSLGATKTK